MEINIFEAYDDSTHIFGVSRVKSSSDGRGLDKYGRSAGPIHREGLNKGQAIQWIKDFVEDGGNPDTFVVVATPRPIWEGAEV